MIIRRNKIKQDKKLCIKWKSEWQIYAKRMIIRRNKIKKDIGKEEE